MLREKLVITQARFLLHPIMYQVNLYYFMSQNGCLFWNVRSENLVQVLG